MPESLTEGASSPQRTGVRFDDAAALAGAADALPAAADAAGLVATDDAGDEAAGFDAGAELTALAGAALEVAGAAPPHADSISASNATIPEETRIRNPVLPPSL